MTYFRLKIEHWLYNNTICFETALIGSVCEKQSVHAHEF